MAPVDAAGVSDVSSSSSNSIRLIMPAVSSLPLLVALLTLSFRGFLLRLQALRNGHHCVHANAQQPLTGVSRLDLAATGSFIRVLHCVSSTAPPLRPLGLTPLLLPLPDGLDLCLLFPLPPGNQEEQRAAAAAAASATVTAAAATAARARV